MEIKHTKLQPFASVDNSIKRIFKHKVTSVAAGLSISLLTFSSVEALNIGEAKTQSYIGQPLSIFVPVTDSSSIIDLNQLVVSKPNAAQLNELNVSSQTNELLFKVVTNGVEKGILITSIQPFNEPYIDLGVQINYRGVTRLRKLTALIDLQPLVGESNIVGSPLVSQAGNTGSEFAESVVSNDVVSTNVVSNVVSIVNQGGNSRTYSNEIMGPYDWAQAGAIPAKFGPVLDGQSLWRVARRINESMNVSIDQMMWALYRANPQAFSADDVTSLQAGSVLTIPEESFVREVTELGAVRLLSAQSSAPASLELDSETVVETVKTDPVVAPVSEETIETIPSLNTTEQSDNTVSLSELNTIDELKNQVSLLTQQLEAQTDRIKELEDRLAISESVNNTLTSSLESVTAQENPSVTETDVVISESQVQLIETPEITEASLSSSSAEEVVAEEVVAEEVVAEAVVAEAVVAEAVVAEAVVAEAVVAEAVVAEAVVAEAVVAEEVVAEEVVAEEVVSEATSTNTTAQNSWLTKFKSFSWPLILGGLAALLGLLFLGKKLIFGNKSIAEEHESLRGDIEQFAQEEFDVEPQQVEQQDAGEVVADESAGSEEFEEFEGFEDFEDYSFFVDDEELMDVEELSFSDRIMQLIDSGDYDEAKKTLNFATAANVDDHEINVSMLKIFAAEEDRESFDKLFDRIHANIEEYDAESQLIVAELQSEMAIGKVINFDSDQMAG